MTVVLPERKGTEQQVCDAITRASQLVLWRRLFPAAAERAIREPLARAAGERLVRQYTSS